MIKFYKQDPLLIEKIWGGTKLVSQSSIAKKKLIGESWQVACLPEGSSAIDGQDLWQKYGAQGGLDFLIKLIDTNDNLSVQVHPDDLLAKKFENSKGKTECWYILDSKKDAKLYLGLKPGVKMSNFHKAIESQENVQLLMNSIAAVKGRFIHVPAGLVHAIGSGITLIEVQQSSGITYRLWDWNRTDQDGNSRELHLEKGLKSLKDLQVKYFDLDKTDKNSLKELIKDKYFSVYFCELEKVTDFEVETPWRFAGITCLSGELTFQHGEDMIELKKWESVLIDNQGESYFQVSSKKSAKFIMAF